MANTFAVVSTERIHISSFLQQSENGLIIDVRSPKEYAHAHLPGAVNIPIFDDEERKIIGTTYKQKSKQLAIKEGLQFFGPKMRSIVEHVEAIAECRMQNAELKDQSGITNLRSQIFIYCWRGGMRSGAMAWLLQLYGFNVTLLAGGYKSFRRWGIEMLARPFQLKILGGFTGSGKTEVLKQLKVQGEPVVDLEAIAKHKGSAFGNLDNTQQPSQEMFENQLALALHKELQDRGNDLNALSIWVEDESQRIGLNNIPGPLWTNMRKAPVYFLNVPFEERLQHLTEEYGIYSKESLAEGIRRISKRLGGLETKNALQYLEEVNISGCFRILLTYYDKFYLKGLHNRAGLTSLLTEIPCSTVSSDNALALLTPASTI